MKQLSMNIFRIIYPGILILFITLSCNSWQSGSEVSPPPLPVFDICQVVQNPYDYQDTMTISGIVTKSGSFLGYSLFILKDKSTDCFLMVVSKKISPPTGKVIDPRGFLKEISNINNNRKLIFIEEGIDLQKITGSLPDIYELFFK
jgi:hypothetical protein